MWHRGGKHKGFAREAARRAVKDYMLGSELPSLYREAAKDPVDPKSILFVNGKLGAVPDAYSVIMPYLEDRYDYEIRFVGLNQSSTGFRSYHARCRRFVKLMARASYVFLEDASDVVSCLPIRPETKVVNLWHACGAFKKWGMGTASKRFGASLAQIKRHPYYGNLDLVTVSSPEVEWAYREAMNLRGTPDIVKALGISRTDVFFDEEYVANARETVSDSLRGLDGRKLLLYAPTFRGPVKVAESPDSLDVRRLKKAIGEEYALVVKHHPFVKSPPPIPEDCRDFAFGAPDGFSAADLLCAADVLMTDYSSVVFEYSLLGRPMVFYAPDLADYIDERGFFYEYDEFAPGPICRTNSELVNALADLRSSFDENRIAAFRAMFMASCDGRATERICDEVFSREQLAAHEKQPIMDVMRSMNPPGPDISIIIPTFNAALTLRRALESIEGQSYDASRIEVIVVDDCSNDATNDVAREFSARATTSVKLLSMDEHQGSPSQPRNRGLAVAQGLYVFFMDADDWLGPEAVERMVRHAYDWDSDVLAVKIKGENGRVVPKSMFLANDPDVDVYQSKIMWTFGSYKLFKRSLAQQLQFLDVMPEDIGYVLRAYVMAQRVSIAADYDYYHLAYGGGGSANISLNTWDDVDLNLQAYRDIFEFVEVARKDGLIPDDADLTVLMRRLFGRDVCNTLATIGNDADHARARRQLSELVRIVGPFYDAKQLETLAVEKRRLLADAFEGLLSQPDARSKFWSRYFNEE